MDTNLSGFRETSENITIPSDLHSEIGDSKVLFRKFMTDILKIANEPIVNQKKYPTLAAYLSFVERPEVSNSSTCQLWRKNEISEMLNEYHHKNVDDAEFRMILSDLFKVSELRKELSRFCKDYHYYASWLSVDSEWHNFYRRLFQSTLFTTFTFFSECEILLNQVIYNIETITPVFLEEEDTTYFIYLKCTLREQEHHEHKIYYAKLKKDRLN